MDLLPAPPKSQFESGLYYFTFGWRLIMQRKLLPFVIFPLLINVALIVGLLWLFISQINGWVDSLLTFMPSWLDWLSYLLVPLAILSVMVVFFFTFTTLANFIAAPFNGLLAEKVELQLTGKFINEMTVAELIKDMPRMLLREWKKMLYAMPRLILLFILGFVPVIGQTVIPVFMFLLSAWLLAIQYCDYPFDNHKVGFPQMKRALSQHKTMNYTFGTLVSVGTMIPVVNLVIMPVAVCGATAMWVSEYRDFFLENEQGKDGFYNRKKDSRQIRQTQGVGYNNQKKITKK